jgi:hypothetical protein
MKKYLAFIAVLALTMGCAITNYPIITDTEGDSANFVVNTNGKALIAYTPGSQVITIWPDQNEELFSFIDQKSDGTGTITTYVNVSFGGYPYKFLGFTYCNPDWTGCAGVTAYDDNVTSFVYTINGNCFASRSLSLLVSYGGRLTECGRSAFTVPELTTVVNSLQELQSGVYAMNLDRRSFSLEAHTDNGLVRVPTYGTHQLKYFENQGVVFKFNQSLVPTLMTMARLSEDYGVEQWRVGFNGIYKDVDAQYRHLSRVNTY